MIVNVEGEGEMEVDHDTRVEELIEELGYHQESVIVLSGDVPIPSDEKASKFKDLKIISVVSGG
ncbi:MAG: hypothetical protein ACQESD_03370 [Thermoplasmatota archaeon]